MAFLKKIFGFTLLLGLGLLCFTEPALAQSSVGDIFSLGGKALVISISSIVIIFCSVFATLFAVLIGHLMGSAFILDAGMGEILKLVWVVMRNLTNVSFTFALLGLAVMVVLGVGGDEQGGTALLKKFLPKFMIAIVLVNFTHFGARVVLSVNDVLATAVFSLPQAVWQENVRGLPCPDTTAAALGAKPNTANCLHEITTKLGEAATTQTEDLQGNQSAGVTERFGGYIQKIYSETDNIFVDWMDRENFALAMLNNMLDLKTVVTLNAANNTFFGTLVPVIGTLITTVLTTFIFFMFLTALVVRMVMLWFLIAVAPLGVAAKIMGDAINIPFLSELDWMKSFLSNAFFPLMAAFPLSIGMIMIFAGNSLTSLGSTSSDAITAALSGDIFALLWWAAAIGVMWVGTKKVIAQSAPIADGLVNGVYDGVNAFGKSAAGAIKYAPIIPIPTGAGGVSPLSFNALKEIPAGFDSHLRGKTAAVGTNIGAGLGSIVRPDLQNEAINLGENIQREIINGVNGENIGQEIVRIFKGQVANGLRADTQLTAETTEHLRSSGGLNGHLAAGAQSVDAVITAAVKAQKITPTEATALREKISAQVTVDDAVKDKAAGDTATTINVSAVVQELQAETDHAAFKTNLDKLAAAVAAGQTLNGADKFALINKIEKEKDEAVKRGMPEGKDWEALLGDKLLQ